MKILVFSDSHTNAVSMLEILSKLKDEVPMVLHLGDCYGDAEFLAKKFPNITVHSVCGNCDYSMGDDNEKVFMVGNKKIFLTHGHKYQVKSGYNRIVYAAMEKEVDVCLFGHTHMPIVFYEQGIVFMNPGSISQPRNAEFPSYGVLDVSDEKINPSVVSVTPLGLKIVY